MNSSTDTGRSGAGSGAPLRAGIIGCGGTGNAHTAGYLASGSYEVVAVADPYEPAMAALDARHAISTRHFTDPRAMLDSEQLDVVSVCTWHQHHAPLVVAAAARRPRAVLCEKPMAVDLRQANEMRTACARNGVRLAISYQRRFLPSYMRARQLIAEGAIGDLVLSRSIGKDGLPNHSSHDVDMIRYLLDDDCAWVMGNVERRTDRWERETAIEDGAVAVFGMRGGATHMLLADVVPMIEGHRYELVGTAGMMVVTPQQLQLMSPDTDGELRAESLTWHYADDAAAPNLSVEAYGAQAAGIAEWIEAAEQETGAGGRRPLHRGGGVGAGSYRGEAENGYRALEMVMAVYESARLHQRIELPLRTLLNPLDVMIERGQLPVEFPGRFDIRAFLLHGERTE